MTPHPTSPSRAPLAPPTRWVLLACFVALGPLLSQAAPVTIGSEPAELKTADLFQGTNLWTVHLKFSADQWAAIEPKGGNRGFFGGGPRGPGGPGGPGGPRGGFGPGMFVAPAFLKSGDKDGDGKLSADEFRGLGAGWFTQWDREKAGFLTEDSIRSGLNSVLESPGFGPPGGGRGPGGAPPLLGAEGKRNGLASAAGIEFEQVHADLEFDGRSFSDVAVRYKGNGTWMGSSGGRKHSLKIDLNKHVKGQKLGGVTKLNLHNNITDASYMNEPLSHRLFRDAGVPAPRTAYARVYVTVAGTYDHEYFGLYSIVEDVDKNFAHDNFGSRKGGIFKPVTPNLFDYLGEDWAKYNQIYDPKSEPTPEQSRRVIDFARLVTKADDAEFAARLGDYLDLDEFARFMAITVWISTMDSILGPGQNYYMHLHPGTGKFQFIPWDLDHGFGQFGLMGSQEQREQLSLRKPWRGENRFLERVFKTEAFKTRYLARLEEYNKGICRTERISAQVDELAPILRPAVKEESAEAVERFDKVVAGEAVAPSGFGGPRPPGGGAEIGRAHV